MTLILIIFCIWGASALVRASKEAKRQREAERQRREAAARSAELARMTAEWKRRQAEAKLETARLIALEREQIRLAKEQERQAAQLEKHEKRIAALEYKVRQLVRNIEAQNELLNDYYAQLDNLLLEQSGMIPGSKSFNSKQNQIVTKNNQIRKAECKLADMKDAKAMAERELAA